MISQQVKLKSADSDEFINESFPYKFRNFIFKVSFRFVYDKSYVNTFNWERLRRQKKAFTLDDDIFLKFT